MGDLAFFDLIGLGAGVFAAIFMFIRSADYDDRRRLGIRIGATIVLVAAVCWCLTKLL